ncbi:RHS repeat-associated core domain-containing protein [Xanthomonas sp. AM6]|uniref:RHS repeat-associated core domain-containing protein n=1 Tax=Xanthomonas sp. AM6 TaxID=2982531 RepID=UPI002952DC10|nr:RHS repeat-associated core domain-containing protein [Xanthomonas sp. AM6]
MGALQHYVGTPRTVIDPVRDVAIWKCDIKGEAFGNSPPDQDADRDGTAFVFGMRFPGQRYDSATELNQNYFRDYDTSTGRYSQSDLIGLSGAAARTPTLMVGRWPLSIHWGCRKCTW